MALAFIFLTNCKGKDGKDATGVLGNLRGKVNLMDEYAANLKYSNGFVENSGVSVSVTKLGLSTTTAADGSFSFPNIPNGTYDVTYSYPGYPVVSALAIVLGDFSSNFNDNIFSYYPISSTQLKPQIRIKYSSSGGAGINFWFGIINPNKTTDSLRRVLIFVGRDAQVSSTNYEWVSEGYNYLTNKDSIFTNVSYSTLYRSGFQLGKNTKCYAIAYGHSNGRNYYYYERRVVTSTSQKPIYPFLSPSKTEVISFILP